MVGPASRECTSHVKDISRTHVVCPRYSPDPATCDFETFLMLKPVQREL
jgi:hypothetical protein